MGVWKVPAWMVEPCRNPGNCIEAGVHAGHIKTPWRWLYRLGLVR